MNEDRGAPPLVETAELRLGVQAIVVAIGLVGLWLAIDYAMAGNWAGAVFVLLLFGTVEGGAVVWLRIVTSNRKSKEEHAG